TLKYKEEFDFLISKTIERKLVLESLASSNVEQKRSRLRSQLDDWFQQMNAIYREKYQEIDSIVINDDEFDRIKLEHLNDLNGFLLKQMEKQNVSANDLNDVKLCLTKLNKSIEELTKLIMENKVSTFEHLMNHFNLYSTTTTAVNSSNNPVDFTIKVEPSFGENSSVDLTLSNIESDYTKQDSFVTNMDHEQQCQIDTAIDINDEPLDDPNQEQQEDATQSDDEDTHEKLDVKLKAQLIRSFKTNKCPLVSKTVFGICKTHNINNIPCNGRHLSEKFGLINHLQNYHDFNYNSSKKIVKLVMAANDSAVDTTIDLFSNENDISNQNVSKFKANCMLNRYNVYGITQKHKIQLCQGEYFHLKDHLILYHNIRASCATKLVEAVMNKINKTEQIIKPDEIIIQEKIQCPLHMNNLELYGINKKSIPNAPCSTILKKFYLQKHLRVGHQLTLKATR
ncbi:unnamed protein product, partial [Didymodactylos carnosus]